MLVWLSSGDDGLETSRGLGWEVSVVILSSANDRSLCEHDALLLANGSSSDIHAGRSQSLTWLRLS